MSLIEDEGNGAGVDQPKRRRRGEDLEIALLDAAWDEFKAVGIIDLTLEGVARRAGTSRAVLYRRWPGKIQMMAAATRFVMLKDRGLAPEPSGSLRTDLIGMLTWVNRTDVRELIEVTQHLGAYLASEGLTFAGIKALVIDSRPMRGFSPIELAIERGEIDPRNVTPRVAGLAFDLFRHEVILNAQPLSDETIRQIVDEIVLPLLMRKHDDGDGRAVND